MNGRAKRFHFMDLTMYQAENSRANGQCDGKSVHFSIREKGEVKIHQIKEWNLLEIDADWNFN